MPSEALLWTLSRSLTLSSLPDSWLRLAACSCSASMGSSPDGSDARFP